ncbi:MAG TPA: universal stress protein [Verrucomicrobiae bacterium]|nr:universal stress protein [Verrucomicrobiae bacterium]
MAKQRTIALHEILVPTDFSEQSKQAFDAALSLAQHFHARLHVFHVVRDHSEERDAETELKSWTREPIEGIESVNTVSAGHAESEIVKYAEQHKIDLIVMGSHGRSGLARVFMGSVAQAVVRDAPCQVLTLGPKAHAIEETAEPEPAPAPPRPQTGRCLVCGKSSPTTICESCRAQIQGEAIERKRKDERPGPRS